MLDIWLVSFKELTTSWLQMNSIKIRIGRSSKTKNVDYQTINLKALNAFNK